MDDNGKPQKLSAGMPVMPPGTEEYLDESLKLAQNYLESCKLISQSMTNLSESLLRDYGNYSLTILGAAITFQTVGPELIRTPELFYISAGILITNVVVIFAARGQIHDAASSFVQEVDHRVSDVSGKIGTVRINPTPENIGALQASSNIYNVFMRSTWIIENGRKLAGLLFFAGFIGFVISLTFEISI